MTQEQKAKAYDEALERAKKMMNSKRSVIVKKQALVTIFPQLTESEDERIIEEIKFAVLQMKTSREDTRQRCLAWLEKQKECIADSSNTSASEDEKTMEEIINWINGRTTYEWSYEWCENKDRWTAYLKKQKEQKPINQCSTLEPTLVEARKWNEAYEKGYSLGYENGRNEQKSVQCIDFDNEFENQVSHLLASVLNGEYEYDNSFIKHAAQSLMGYAKNELKPEMFNKAAINGEPIPTENQSVDIPLPIWSENDERIIDTIVSVLGQYIDYKAVSGTGSGYATPRYSKEIDWLNSLRTTNQRWSKEDEKMRNLIVAIFEVNHPDDFFKANELGTTDMRGVHTEEIISWLKSLRPQPKQEWSEEDKEMLQSCIDSVKYELLDNGMDDEVETDPRIIWLKSLTEKFNLQPKQEWSKKNKDKIESIKTLVTTGKFADINTIKTIWELLDSLRPQPKQNVNDVITPNKKFFQWIYDRLVNVHKENPNVDYMISFKRRIEELSFDKPSWKPSEEQMDALEEVIVLLTNLRRNTGDRKNLESLYEQLKKLM